MANDHEPKPPAKETKAAGQSGWIVGIIPSLVVAAILGGFGFFWSMNALTSSSQERLKNIESRLDELKSGPSDVSTLQTSLNTANQEIINLRNEVASLQGFNQKHEGETTHASNEINQLRQDMKLLEGISQKHEDQTTTAINEINTLRRQEEETCSLLAQIQQRIATLEAKQGAESKPAAK